jgi:hypothetical protein
VWRRVLRRDRGHDATFVLDTVGADAPTYPLGMAGGSRTALDDIRGLFKNPVEEPSQ